MDISIIIPVYNVEQYIEQCLKSVASQTYTGDLECIIIDDCGTDNSIQIAKDFICHYHGNVLFRIIRHNQNRGLSAARNTGIREGKGKYIMFLDSDDYLPKSACDQLHAGFTFYKEKIASVAGQFYKDVDGNISSYKQRWEVNVPKLISSKDYLSLTLCEEISFTVTAKLFKTDIIRKISFSEGKTNEDTLFTYDLALLYEKENLNEIVIPDFVYYYRMRPNSICTSSETPLILSVFQNQREILKRDKRQHPEFEKKYYKIYISKLYNFCFQALDNEDWRQKYFKQYSNYFSDIPFKFIFDNFNGKQLVKAILLYLFPHFLDYIYKYKCSK